MGIDPNEMKKHISKRLQNGNRRERKLKPEIKQLRQLLQVPVMRYIRENNEERAHRKRRRYLNNSSKQ